MICLKHNYHGSMSCAECDGEEAARATFGDFAKYLRSTTAGEAEDLTLFQCKLDRSKCDHDWKHGDGRDDDVCTKCGQGFMAYVFMEAP